MNISLLTADFWSVLAGVALLNSQLSGWYPAAFAATMTGLVLFYLPERVAVAPAVGVARHGLLTEPLNGERGEREEGRAAAVAAPRLEAADSGD